MGGIDGALDCDDIVLPGISDVEPMIPALPPLYSIPTTSSLLHTNTGTTGPDHRWVAGLAAQGGSSATRRRRLQFLLRCPLPDLNALLLDQLVHGWRGQRMPETRRHRGGDQQMMRSLIQLPRHVLTTVSLSSDQS